MTEHKSLAAALAAFQGAMPSVHKGNTAKVPTKSGGQYTYTYADLADVSKAAMPILSEHGLSFTCSPGVVDGKLMLTGTLMHTSGESREGVLPLTGGGPQELGSSLTYMRRYLLGALTGIVTDDDDDGQRAQAGARREQQRPAAPPQQRPAERTSATEDRITASQSRSMGRLMERVGLPDKATRLAFVTDVLKRPVSSPAELTVAEADKLLEVLQAEVEKIDAAQPAPDEAPEPAAERGES